MNTTWTNGKHQYKGTSNDRSKRQHSKIFKGMKRVPANLAFERIDFEKKCEKFIYNFNPNSSYLCKNCRNYLCEKNI
jgi:hypothetical protein